ncbi:hypothetical protein ACFVH6_05430, partial [Spirillospora sp. NPDC127200]
MPAAPGERSPWASRATRGTPASYDVVSFGEVAVADEGGGDDEGREVFGLSVGLRRFLRGRGIVPRRK